MLLLKTRQHHRTGLRFYVIWLQCISRSCSELVLSIIIFLPLKKRLMSPENPTRKVNTILKCQEINGIVLSSYGPVEEGDKCLALFTRFLPICDLSLFPSYSLCLCVRFPFTLHLPPSVSCSFSSADRGLRDLFPLPRVCKWCGCIQWHNTGGGCAPHYVQPSVNENTGASQTPPGASGPSCSAFLLSQPSCTEWEAPVWRETMNSCFAFCFSRPQMLTHLVSLRFYGAHLDSFHAPAARWHGVQVLINSA